MGRSVPEWMNSSLWSSFDERHLANHATSPSPRDGALRPSDTQTPVQRVPPPSPPPPVSFPHTSSSSATRASQPTCFDEATHSSGPAPDDAPRRARFLSELSKRVIDLAELRRLAAQGVPDSCGIRSVVWKILLGYLPCNRERWADELSKKRAQYALFKEEYLINPSEVTRRLERFSSSMENENAKHERKGVLSRSKITNGEHPLSIGKTSVWRKYFQDLEFIEQIDRDVKRTHPDMPFFSGDSSTAKSNQVTSYHMTAFSMVSRSGITSTSETDKDSILLP